MGPFLFLFAINDFPSNIPCRTVLYADDKTLVQSGKETVKLQIDQSVALNSAESWFKSNQLSINKQKKFIFFSLSKPFEIEYIKLLGLQLDSTLKWDVHIENLCTKLSTITYLLRKLKLSVSYDMLINAYYAFFHSQMVYGETV